MKAIILAAGYGNRMRPLTDNVHKTLLTVCGKTIIEGIVDGLVDNGVHEIIVVTGYRDAELRTFLTKRYPDVSLHFVHNERYRETNNIYSMARAFENTVIDDDIILIESDLIYQGAVIRRIIESPFKNAALVDKYRSGMDGTVVTVENGVISSVIPPHLQDEKFDFSDKYKTLNIYKFSKEFCNSTFKKLLTYYATVINDNCYYELILGILIYMQQETVHAEILSGEKWAEVDDPNDLHVAEFAFDENKRLSILEEGFGGYWNYDILDFAFIRNMYFPNSSIISEMRNSLPELLYNYGSRQSVLDRKMAWFLLCRQENVHALGGASQIFPVLQMRFSEKKVCIPSPTFGEYTRIFPNAKTYGDAVGFDVREIEEKAGPCDVVVFVNPNNPTGSSLDAKWIETYAGKNPKKTIVVDESFIEFSVAGSIMPACEKGGLENVIIVKSLSKSMGMPGLRLGYVYSTDKDFMAFAGNKIPIWNMNSMAEFTMEIILKHRKSLAGSFQDTIRDRQEFMTALSKLSCVDTVFPSQGNFFLARLRGKKNMAAEIVNNLLSRHSIFVKDISHKFNDDHPYLRIAVRLSHENAKFVSAIAEFCN